MKGKMQGVTLVADWEPKPGFKLGKKDIEGRQTYLGSQVWRNPRLEIREYDIPTPGPEEVILQVKACGICGSDVHMAQADKDGYIYYPGLTGFPSILGHEFSGVVVEAGKHARDKRTNKPFKGGEAVTSEEMLWCGQCKPCADGQPNHCEQLDEVGFNVNGAYTKYIVLPSRTIWSLEPLRKNYQEKDIFIAGSLVEPTCVAYNAVIERGGGIKPGDRVATFSYNHYETVSINFATWMIGACLVPISVGEADDRVRLARLLRHPRREALLQAEAEHQVVEDRHEGDDDERAEARGSNGHRGEAPRRMPPHPTS